MAFREVAMHEVTEVLRLWSSGAPLARIAQVLSLDRKTVRRYVEAGRQLGLRVGAAPTHEQLAGVAAAIQAMPGRPHGESWSACEARRGFIAEQLAKGLKLSKVRRLLAPAAANSVCDAAPLRRRGAGLRPHGGDDAGGRRRARRGAAARHRLGLCSSPSLGGKRRRFRAWIFTPCFSRYRFVYPVLRETHRERDRGVRGGMGVLRRRLPRARSRTTPRRSCRRPTRSRRCINTGVPRVRAGARLPHRPRARAQPARQGARRARVQTVRDDCFGGENLWRRAGPRARARHWCAHEYGMRRHATTQRCRASTSRPRRRPQLLPAPTERVRRAAVVRRRRWRATSTRRWPRRSTRCRRGSSARQLRARADRATVRFYWRGRAGQGHPRKAAGRALARTARLPREKTRLRDARHRLPAEARPRARRRGGRLRRGAARLATALDAHAPRLRAARARAALRRGARRATCASRSRPDARRRRASAMLKLGLRRSPRRRHADA